MRYVLETADQIVLFDAEVSPVVLAALAESAGAVDVGLGRWPWEVAGMPETPIATARGCESGGGLGRYPWEDDGRPGQPTAWARQDCGLAGCDCGGLCGVARPSQGLSGWLDAILGAATDILQPKIQSAQGKNSTLASIFQASLDFLRNLKNSGQCVYEAGTYWQIDSVTGTGVLRHQVPASQCRSFVPSYQVPGWIPTSSLTFGGSGSVYTTGIPSWVLPVGVGVAALMMISMVARGR